MESGLLLRTQKERIALVNGFVPIIAASNLIELSFACVRNITLRSTGRCAYRCIAGDLHVSTMKTFAAVLGIMLATCINTGPAATLFRYSIQEAGQLVRTFSHAFLAG